MKEVFLSSGARSALGDFGGSLKNVQFTELASTVAKASLTRSGINPSAIDHIVFTLSLIHI